MNILQTRQYDGILIVLGVILWITASVLLRRLRAAEQRTVQVSRLSSRIRHSAGSGSICVLRPLGFPADEEGPGRGRENRLAGCGEDEA